MLTKYPKKAEATIFYYKNISVDLVVHIHTTRTCMVKFWARVALWPRILLTILEKEWWASRAWLWLLVPATTLTGC